LFINERRNKIINIIFGADKQSGTESEEVPIIELYPFFPWALLSQTTFCFLFAVWSPALDGGCWSIRNFYPVRKNSL